MSGPAGRAGGVGAGIPVIDGHVHVNRFDLMTPGARSVIESNPTFSQMERFVQSPEAFLEHLDREGIAQAWLINYCAKEVMGYGDEVNAWVAEYVSADRKRLVAVGGYEPSDADGAAAMDRLHSLGIKALKIHTVHQHLSPDDPRLEPAFRRCEELRMPVIFHTGTSRFPGADNRFADPAPIAAVCSRHPKLQAILAHGGRPHHTAQALQIIGRFPNAWLDLSSCPPSRLGDYFGDLERLASRTLWGSDWPGPGVPGMRANVDAFLSLGLSEDTNRAILHDNAARLLAGVR